MNVQQAIDYMEEHLLDDINYEDVAAMMHLSCFHFHRTFRYLAGMTANEYIRNRRLSLAGQEMVNTNEKVIDLALKYGYETPESFTKAFTRFHGVSPRNARQPGTSLCLFNPMTIHVSMEGGKIMDYRIEKMNPRRYIALARMFQSEGENKVPEFWEECHVKNLVEPIRDLRPEGKKDLYGLCQPTQHGEPTFRYGIGVIIDDDTKQDSLDELVLQDFEIWEMPACQYVVFSCYDTVAGIKDIWKRFYTEFLPQTTYEADDSADFEFYPQFGPKGLFCEIWIPIHAKNQ